MFCCTLLYVHSSIAIILMGKRELVALLNLSSRCLVIVERLLLAVPQGCLRFVIVVFPDHTHLLFLTLPYICLNALTFYILRKCPCFSASADFLENNFFQKKMRNTNTVSNSDKLCKQLVPRSNLDRT